MNFTVSPLAPFRLEYCAWALKRRPVNAIDRWDGETYSRVLVVDGRPILVAVRQSGSRLLVEARGARPSLTSRVRISSALEKLLGPRVDMAPFYRFAEHDPALALLARRFRGLKPPRFPSVFEALVNGIACQQLSLHVGLTLLNRLSERVGVPFPDAAQTYYGFPDAEALASLPLRSYRSLGFSHAKATALRSLGDHVASGKFAPEQLQELSSAAAEERLLELHGVGEWTATYVLLRGLGRTDIFPLGDVGAQSSLARWKGLRTTPARRTLERIFAKWSPFAGMVYFHLLLNGIEQAGYLERTALAA